MIPRKDGGRARLQVLLFAFLAWVTGNAFAVDVQISQLVDNPDPAVRAGLLTYTLAVVNGSADTANNVVLSVPLPATTTFVSTNSPACTHNGATPGVVTCALGNITGDGLGGPVTSVDVVARTTVATGFTLPVAATVSTASADTNIANNTGTQNTTIDDGADLTVAVTDIADPVIAGATIGYTLTVNNAGPNPAVATVVTDTLPTGTTFVSASGSGWVCSAIAQVVTCNRPSNLANGASAPVINVVTRVTGAISGTVTNAVTVTSSTGDPEPNNNTTTENTQITVGADTSISKVVTPSTVVASSPATFTLRPRNAGPFDASTVTVTDVVPAGFTVDSVVGGAWTCGTAGNTVTCTRASLVVGATDDILINVTAPPAGAFTNTATIAAVTADPQNGNNSGSLSGTAAADGADLAISKSKSPNPVAQNSPTASTIGVHNNGPRPTSGVITVVDTLDAGESFDSFAGANWNCVHSGATPGGVVTCTFSGAPLASGGNTSSLTINSIATAAGTLSNSATVTDVGGTTDPDLNNNTAVAASGSTNLIADLTISKTATTPNGNGTLEINENRVTYTIAVTNNGPDAVGGVVMTDNVAGFVGNVADAVPDTTAVGVSDDSGGRFNCTTGATVTCTLANGQTMANGETVTFTLTADRPLLDGTINNTASVTSTELGDNNRLNNSASATVDVDPLGDIELSSKVVTPNTVPAGTQATYVITVINNGPSASNNVQVSDVFAPPPGRSFTFVSSGPSKGSCAAFAANTLNCDLGTLSKDETATVTVVVRPDWDVQNDAWTLPNTATVTTTSPDTNAVNNSQTANLPVTPAVVDLLVNKTDLRDPTPFDPTNLPGNVIVYRVNMTNRGPSLATNVVLRDVFSPKSGKQLTFMCDDAGAVSCAAGTSLCNNIASAVTGPAALSIDCAIPDMSANQTVVRHLFFHVDSPPDGSGDTHDDVASLDSNEDDAVTSNDSEAEATTVRVKVDLGVTKSAASNPVALNEPFNFTITVTDHGPGDSDQSDLADTLPAGMVLTATPTPAQGTCTGSAGQSSFTCALGAIAANASVAVTVPVRITTLPVSGTLTNTATVTTNGLDTVPANDTASDVVTVQKSSLAGTVFSDADDDGVQDAGENGIAGVTLTLTGSDAFNNTVNLTATTDASGNYLFDNLSPSNGAGYTVTEAQAAGFVDGLESKNGVVQAGSRGSDALSAIAVAANTAVIDQDFAEVPNTAIAGVVWVDENGNGVRDAAEVLRILGVTITLSGTDDLGNPVNQTTTTAADGSYSFNNLRRGTYRVAESQPAAWSDSGDVAGTAGGTVANDAVSAIALGANIAATGYDFGESGNSLAGLVFSDLDGDGVRDPNEPGLPGVTLTLTGTDSAGNAVSRSVTTGADGSYRINGVPQSNGSGYTLTETQPAGVNDGKDSAGSAGGVVANDVITGIKFPAPGTHASGYNFGEGLPVSPAKISGRVFFDGNHNRQDDENSGQSGWTVQLVQRGDATDFLHMTTIATALTDAKGDYQFKGLSPGTYEVIFRHPDGGIVYGKPISSGNAGNTDFGTIRGIVLNAGDDVIAQNLPLDPSGVVYDAITRTPVAGAVVAIQGPAGFNPAVHLIGGADNVSQTTGSSGQYQFLLTPTAPAGVYTLKVTSPGGYLPGLSGVLPPCEATLTVAPVPNPALVQVSATPPAANATVHAANACANSTSSAAFASGATGTQYYVNFNLTPGLGGSANLINNHLPLDPVGSEVVSIVKTAAKTHVTRGDLVPYTLRIRNNLTGPLLNLDVVDALPPGFKFREGSATLDGQSVTPDAKGRQLLFHDVDFNGNQERTLKLIAVVGAGVAEANYTNRAWSLNIIGNTINSNVASAVVRVLPDPLIDCSEVIGKVFDDRNRDGFQDEGEKGIANARVIGVDGLLTTTDAYGRYHVACIAVPDEERGSNAVLKLDVHTLPLGYEVTSENPRVVRLTRGKMTRVNFGATPRAEAVPGPTDIMPATPPAPTSSSAPAPAAPAASKAALPASAATSLKDTGAAAASSTATAKQSVELNGARLRMRYDSLEQTPWLNLHATPDAAARGHRVRFMPYSNYLAFIARAEVRLYPTDSGARGKPLQVLPIGEDGLAVWDVPQDFERVAVDYVLRVEDSAGRFDQTRAKRLEISKEAFKGREDDLFAGYGENSRDIANIPVQGGAVTVDGDAVVNGAEVSVMGHPVPVDKAGKFAARQILPAGEHAVAVSITRQDGQRAEVERRITIPAEQWMYVALGDLTVGGSDVDGPLAKVTDEDDARFKDKAYVDGRLAFYLKGKVKGKYLLTAAADTREQQFDELFHNFTRKDPRSLFRRLDPDRYYPVYGDDSTTVQDAPTQGRFYVKVERDDNDVMWGDFQVHMNDSELIRQNRGLYGARVNLNSKDTTRFGEKRGQLSGFAAEPGTVPGRDEFRGTGGSLYYLRRQDVQEGSEWVAIEVRDRDTGLVLETRTLVPNQDYDVNYLQGRILLTRPLMSTVSDHRTVHNGGLAGQPAYLVVTYEYQPGLGRVDDLAVGGRGSYWLNDHIRLGLTNYRQDSPGASQTLYGGDVTMRWTEASYVRVEKARSEGPGSGATQSLDGGFNFVGRSGGRGGADAHHVEAALDLDDLGLKDRGDARLYWQDRDHGFSSPGQLTTGPDASRKGADLKLRLSSISQLSLHASEAEADSQRLRAIEAELENQVTRRWSLGLGLRSDDNEVRTPTASSYLNRAGVRSDLAVKLGFKPDAGSRSDWSSYGFVQGTVDRSGDRRRNDRVGLGGDIRFNDRFKLNSELSTGRSGIGAMLGGEWQRNDRTTHYLNYGLDPDRTDIGFGGRQGDLTSGTRYRFADHGSVYGEQRYSHGDGPTGMVRAFGLDMNHGDNWTYGLRGEFGDVHDPLAGDLTRRAGGGSLGYHDLKLQYAADVEIRDESGTTGNRTTWLARNNASYQLNLDWRALARFNVSFSNGAGGNFADGEFAEAVAGMAYRPVANDRLNMLLRYHFFYDLPSPGQLTRGGDFADFAQRSNILSLDTTYELNPWLALGGKLAWKHGEIRDNRIDGPWFDSQTWLGVGRFDVHITNKWDAVVEGRVLDITEADDQRAGVLVGVYRQVNKNVKFGAGYNFTDFSDDLTDLSYRHQGVFINLIGAY